jgi:hypothetical protein
VKNSTIFRDRENYLFRLESLTQISCSVPLGRSWETGLEGSVGGAKNFRRDSQPWVRRRYDYRTIWVLAKRELRQSLGSGHGG